MAYLEHENGTKIGDIINQSTLLGRATHADIQFPEDLGCSREQAWIEQCGNEFQIRPISENARTYVNGNPIQSRTYIRDGDAISFGNQRLIFRLNEESLYLPSANECILASSAKTIIGRSVEHANFILDHPLVSRRHAEFSGGPKAEIRDSGSTNGTFVNGTQIHGAHQLSAGDRVEIGPFQLVFDGTKLELQIRPGEASLTGTGLCVDVANPEGGTKRILNDASMEIRPGEFVCIVGPSGSGKSTLMKVLSGRHVPTSGAVQVGNLDLFQNFENLKHKIAFVPQHDVLHESLTLKRALTYTAMLRLPKDTLSDDRNDLIFSTVQKVDLDKQLNNKISTLSGGQKKRASLASETLSKPGLVFLDEVTSGLDEATDREIMRTLHQKAFAGMTIVCVTHTMSNIDEFCDRLIIMAEGGVIAFDGTPKNALAFFNADRLGQIFDCLKEKPAEYWYKQNRQAPVKAEHKSTLYNKDSSYHSPVQFGRLIRQFSILTRRNIELIVTDRRGLIMAIVQSVLIGILVGYAFSNFGTGYEVVNSQSALLLLLGLCSIWLGCNSASQEIVGELQIFRREHDVNLSAVAFVLSKFFTSTTFTALQFCVVFALVASFSQEIPGAPLQQLLFLLVGCMSGTAMGLLLSSLANTNEQATTIVPLTLVPQLIFAGVLVPKLPEFAIYFAEVAVSGYWLTEGLKSNLIESNGPIMTIDIATGADRLLTAASAEQGLIVICGHIVAFLLLTIFFVIRRASRK